MRHTTRLSSIQALRPVSHADWRAIYELVRDGLLKSDWLEPELARRLAVVSARHLAGGGGRVLLRGAPEAGKRELARAVSDVIDLPILEIDAGLLSEMNWAGADLGFFLERLYDELHQQYPRAAVPEIAEHACIFIHSLDSVRVPGAYTSVESTRDYREGKQQSLAALCSGGSIPISTGQGRGHVWRGRSALVIAAAQLDGLPEGRQDSDALIDWGLTPSLARALAAFTFLELPSLSPARVEAAIRTNLLAVTERFLAFGFRLEVTDQAIRYVIEAISTGRNSGGPSAASGWIEDAAEATLIRLLEERAPVGATITLARDDVTLPEPGRGIWRE